MRGVEMCMIVVSILVAAVPVECRAAKPVSAPPPPPQPVTVSESCSTQCSTSYPLDSEQYNACIADCEKEPPSSLPPSGAFAPSALP